MANGTFLTLPKARGLYITHINVCSLLPKVEFLKVFLNDNHIHIAILTETKLMDSSPASLLNIPNFNLYRQDRKDRQGGGIAAYVRDNICVDALEFSKRNEYPRHFESFWISCQPSHMKKMVFECVYRPPSGNHKIALDIIRDDLDFITRGRSWESHIVGDINFNQLDKQLPATRTLNAMLMHHGFHQYIAAPTRVTHSTSTLLDIHATNCKSVADSGVFPLNLSDHFLTYLRKKQTPPIKKNNTFRVRSYTKFNKEDFIESLNKIDWDPELEYTPTVSTAWAYIESELNNILDSSCPIVTVRTSKIKAPWMTQELLTQIRAKDTLMDTARRSNLELDWRIAKKERNSIRNRVKRAKSDYFIHLLKKYKGDGRRFWKVVRELVGDGGRPPV